MNRYQLDSNCNTEAPSRSPLIFSFSTRVRSRPALAAIDSTHLLLVYTDGDGVQKATVLDGAGAMVLPSTTLGTGR